MNHDIWKKTRNKRCAVNLVKESFKASIVSDYIYIYIYFTQVQRIGYVGMEDDSGNSVGKHNGDDQQSDARNAVRVPSDREERSGRWNVEQTDHDQDPW